MSRVLSLAGFQVTLIGRFWVTTEGAPAEFGIWNVRTSLYSKKAKLRRLRRGIRFFGETRIGNRERDIWQLMIGGIDSIKITTDCLT
jgi:hypothetical protein